ncbi:SPOSA6832_01280 [Sporobolomyces salmonicolor]|uniref:SPOSA6832_01280-mRNA-1:cds n=1 Tax=Sporidiobolus salmonicolor TaxID=5005 RepID=A0A0D6EIF6_SPOSA|nr:SPOSA6832_01280 [Sporobolomyces salmonicolor]
MSFRGHQKQASSFGGGSWSLPPLPFQQTLVLHTNFALKGAADAVKLQVAGEKLSMDKVVQANVLKSTLLQSIVLASALVIKPILRRAVGVVEGSSTRGVTSSILYVLFHALWLYPLAAAATYYSGLLTPSEETTRRGMAPRQPAQGGLMAKIVAESYRTLVTLNYFAFFLALRWIPFVGGLFAFLYACIIDAYYCFEQHWVRNGWPFDDRVRHVEQRWAYALGFGFPITLLSWWSSDPIVNLAVFALLYPLFQLTSTVSIPQPLDPSLPSTSSTAASFLAPSSMGVPSAGASFSIAAAEGGSEDRGRRGSPWFPERIRVLIGADLTYKALRAAFGSAGGGGGRKKDAMGHGHGGRAAYGGHAAAAPGAGGSGGYGPSDYYGSGGYAQGAAGYAQTSPQRQPAPSAPGASAYGSAYSSSDPYGATATASSMPYAGPSPAAATPPRRGHAMSESTDVGASPYGGGAGAAYGGAAYSSPVGPGAAYTGYGGDRKLDGMIRAAGGRKKGD